MKNIWIVLFIFFFGVSCTNDSKDIGQDTSEVKSTIETRKDLEVNTEDEEVDESTNIFSEFNFLSDCDSLQIWFGGIQGTSNDDLTCCYMMAQCQTNRHFDLIVYSESQKEIKGGADYNNMSIKDDIENVEYFAFEIPKKKPDNPENEFDTFDYVFPSGVKVYKREKNNWKFIQEVEVNSFEELGKLKLKTLKNTHHSR